MSEPLGSPRSDGATPGRVLPPQTHSMQISRPRVHAWTTDSAERRRLGRRAQLLAATPVIYDTIKAAIAIAIAAVVAGSVARVWVCQGAGEHARRDVASMA